MSIPQILFCIGAIIFLFAVSMLWWLGAPPKRADIKFAWWPHRIAQEIGPNMWMDTGRYVIGEYVRVHKTFGGNTIYFRLH